LLELNVEGGELARWCVNADVERALLSDHRRLIDGDNRTGERAGVVKRHTERKSRRISSPKNQRTIRMRANLTALLHVSPRRRRGAGKL
jgi:hypothetical protein